MGVYFPFGCRTLVSRAVDWCVKRRGSERKPDVKSSAQVPLPVSDPAAEGRPPTSPGVLISDHSRLIPSVPARLLSGISNDYCAAAV